MSNRAFTRTQLLDYVGKITETDYINSDMASDMAIDDLLETALDDLLKSYDDLKDEFEDFRHNVEENYKRPSREEEIGYHMNW
jgi:acyl carrier protein phosphodiesterase